MQEKPQQIKVSVSAEIYGAKLGLEATFDVDPVESKNPESLREALEGARGGLYGIFMRSFTTSASFLAMLQRFCDGCFRGKTPKEACSRPAEIAFLRDLDDTHDIVGVIVVDVRAVSKQDALDGRPEPKRLPSAD